MINKENLEKIATFILDGLSEQDACKLCDIDYDALQILKEKNKDVKDFIDKKRIRFELNHLKEIQSHKSEKNSQWILEKLIPEKYGNRVRGQEAPTVNIINNIVREIQNGNQDPLAKYTIGGREITNEDDKVKKLKVASVLN